ncbi:SDR family oxidoreductase [Paraburkholderia phytofirmans]|uniref:SDR family oxidoreductase n=1 Tax=Paraburkholderia phytofirmans TaxID=261302 RepID=UPI0038B747E6
MVTGAFGVLGRAVCELLRERGAKVAGLDKASSVTGALASQCSVALGDVDLGDPESATRAVSAAVQQLGGLDSLVNIAGGFAWELVDSGNIETWDRLYGMNVRTAVIASQAALPALREHGVGACIVNVGSMSAQKAGRGAGAYASSKSGVARLTEALAEELKGEQITVNAVLPSVIDTPGNRESMPKADTSRWVAPRELAAVIAFLLSDDARSITGALLPVAGRM